jgi:hypothetical protein
MPEGTPVTRKLKQLTAPFRQKSAHIGKPPMDVFVAELVADLLETVRPHAGLYDMKAPDVANVLEDVAASLLKIGHLVRQE